MYTVFLSLCEFVVLVGGSLLVQVCLGKQIDKWLEKEENR